jgi:UDP-N-acetylmuramyl pentapeptide phosphotransferase/UDP-N-acetylglucosamine-1-phosphate transferase
MFDAMLVAAFLSCSLSVLIVWSRGWHGKLSMDHDLTGIQKFHAIPVPRVGGIALVLGILGTLALANLFAGGIVGPFAFNAACHLMIAAMPAFIAGVIEDITKIVSVKARLIATFASALLASRLLGATLDGIDIWGIDALLLHVPAFALVATAVTVAGGTNAMNIIDGFNGLAATAAVLILAALALLAWQADDSVVFQLALLGIGATIGFLIVNYPTGKLFLGDGGAYFLGFWISELAVLLLVRNSGINAWQVLGVCAYPIIEVGYSIYRRKFVRNVNAGAPDRLHLHTLIYRRVICQYIAHNPKRPWLRNAAVVWVVGALIAAMNGAAVWFGTSLAAAVGIVIAELVVYILIYRRLVCGRWQLHPVLMLRAARK